MPSFAKALWGEAPCKINLIRRRMVAMTRSAVSRQLTEQTTTVEQYKFGLA
jgi:hypothetical protein